MLQHVPVGEALRPGKLAGREHPHSDIGEDVGCSLNADRDEPEAIFRRDGMQGRVRGASEALPVIFGKECGNEGRLSSASRHDRGHGFSAGCPDAVAEVPLEVRGTQRMVRPLSGNGMQGGARSVAHVGATHLDHVRGAQGMVIDGGHRPGRHVHGLADDTAEVLGKERPHQSVVVARRLRCQRFGNVGRGMAAGIRHDERPHQSKSVFAGLCGKG